jgi:NAD(P)-dependent dehydrogenase (short-subunit alcohol dehydrogenase family)
VSARTALVTGANRGLGLRPRGSRPARVSRRHERSRPREGGARRRELRGEGLDVVAFELDVRSDEAVARLGELGPVDALVNNAGIVPESAEPSRSALSVPADRLCEAFETNTLGAYRTIQALAPGMRSRSYGRIVNVSSGMGQLSDMWGGNPAYRLSKTALNALTRIFASELAGTGVLVNSVCPGWVRTDMGGPGASLSVEEGVETIVWAATLPTKARPAASSATGSRFPGSRHRRPRLDTHAARR